MAGLHKPNGLIQSWRSDRGDLRFFRDNVGPSNRSKVLASYVAEDGIILSSYDFTQRGSHRRLYRHRNVHTDQNIRLFEAAAGCYTEVRTASTYTHACAPNHAISNARKPYAHTRGGTHTLALTRSHVHTWSQAVSAVPSANLRRHTRKSE